MSQLWKGETVSGLESDSLLDEDGELVAADEYPESM